VLNPENVILNLVQNLFTRFRFVGNRRACLFQHLIKSMASETLKGQTKWDFFNNPF